MWYSNMYRRHLCDMHIDDWNESFLSEFSPEVYVENLKTARIQNAMLYFQSHVGLCYYPTKVGKMHRAFEKEPDKMRRLVDLCHQNGIQVTGYYSLNYNTLESDRHPDWRMQKAPDAEMAQESDSVTAFATARSSRYGLCCPNNFEYREFVYKQIDEMLDYFTVEGMFFDMPFWPYETCFCDKCRARWEKEVGTPFPKAMPGGEDREYLIWMQKRHEWMGEWIAAVTAYVKKRNPALSVEHNFAQGIDSGSHNGCAYEVNAASDFVGGDLYGGIWHHSLACKFYQNITRNAPFDYMFSRCKPGLPSHTLTKTEDEMLVEVLATTAHHGATMVIDAIDPVGTLDKRVYERVGKIFEVEAAYEPYLTGEMVEDLGLYYGAKSRFGRTVCGSDSRKACAAASKAMIASHIPFGVTGPFHRLTGYKALVMPLISEQDGDTARILEHVANGGALYFSGARHGALLKALTGGTRKDYTEEKKTYLAPTAAGAPLFGDFNPKYPLPFDYCVPVVEGVKDVTVLATLTLPYTKPTEISFASIHSNPPGIATAVPMMVEGTYGKGKFIWSAAPIEAVEMAEYQDIFLACLRRLLGDYTPSFVSDAADDVEITLYEDKDCYLVNAIHLDERVKMPTLAPFEIGVKCDGPVKAVELLPQKTPVPFEVRDGYVFFQTKPMHVFDMYRILK